MSLYEREAERLLPGITTEPNWRARLLEYLQRRPEQLRAFLAAVGCSSPDLATQLREMRDRLHVLQGRLQEILADHRRCRIQAN